MATLAQEKISVTLPGEVSAFFHRRAREANTTVDHEIAAVAWAFMEHTESPDSLLGTGASDAELPQWEKDFIDQRLDVARRHPGRLKPVATLLETL